MAGFGIGSPGSGRIFDTLLLVLFSHFYRFAIPKCDDKHEAARRSTSIVIIFSSCRISIFDWNFRLELASFLALRNSCK